MKKMVVLCFMAQILFGFYPSVQAYAPITKSEVELHMPSFLRFVESQRSLISWFRCLWPRTLQKVALLARGYKESLSLKCIESAYPFFDRAKNGSYARRIVALMPDLAEHIARIIDRYRTEGPSNPDFLCKMTYQETVKHMPYLNQETHDSLIVAGLFAKYWIEVVKK